MDLPIHNNKKRGVAAKTLKRLQHQPSDLNKETQENDIYDELTEQEPSSKRQRLNDDQSKMCATCGKALKKKLYYFCPTNKCKQTKLNLNFCDALSFLCFFMFLITFFRN